MLYHDDASILERLISSHLLVRLRRVSEGHRTLSL